jgi:hypothetical protein
MKFIWTTVPAGLAIRTARTIEPGSRRGHYRNIVRF